MNILILSCGTRNKIVQYFKRELEGKGYVIVTDCSSLAPALYEADRHYIVPRITDENYIGVILDICRKEKISGVLSLIDPELSLLAKHEEWFHDIGVKVIGSPYEQCERSLDKWEMYQWLMSHGYNCARTYIDKNRFHEDRKKGILDYPVFVKPRCGSASIAISKVHDSETLDVLWEHNEDLIIQEFLDGQEIGVDCYIDMISQRPVSIFLKKKLVMRAGETDKSISFHDPELFRLVERFVREFGYLGQIDIDVFDVNGDYFISEVNPRFGGGYPHAYECGVNHMKLIVGNLEGVENTPVENTYEDGCCMMKYNDVLITETR